MSDDRPTRAEAQNALARPLPAPTRRAYAVVWADEPTLTHVIAAATRKAALAHARVGLRQRMEIDAPRRAFHARGASEHDHAARTAPGEGPYTIGWHDATSGFRWGCCETTEES